jgi:DNA-binding Lrp family transcriptional regulator
VSSKPNLTNEKIEQLKLKFEDYKNSKLTLDVISKELKMDRSAVGKWFKKLFNNQYSELSKKRCGWKIKLKDEEIKELFESYKNGTSMIELAEEFKIKRDSLAQRMRRLIGLEYSNISSLRKLESGGRKRQKVSDEKIKEIFEIYKMSKMSLDELSTKIGIRESSLISRFKKLFRCEYMLIARSRRDERKLTVLECKEAFDRYKNSNTSLIQLSEELDISCSSLSHRFKKIFGDEYLKISEKKLEMYEVNKKGNLAENLALEFLKLKWKNINDVREKHILKGTLKRPDFIIGNAFIEVKNYYITMSGLGRLKGYKDILRDYLSKEVNDEGKSIILQKGIIISLSGFSPEVINKSKIDDILIFGPEDLEKTFKENDREDLIKLLKH